MSRIQEIKFFNEVLRDMPNIVGELIESDRITEIMIKNHKYKDYVTSVALSLIELDILFGQLEQAIMMLTTFRDTAKLKQNNITKHDYFIYNLENYLIRLISVDDRLLNLIDKVYSLGNPDKNCVEPVVMQNLVFYDNNLTKKKYYEIKRHLDNNRKHRNVIIHHKSYRDDELRNLELYREYIRHDNMNLLGGPDKEIIENNYKEDLRYYIKDKKEEFKNFNNILYILISDLLEELNLIYTSKKNMLLNNN